MSVRFIPMGKGTVVALGPFGQTLGSDDLTNYAMTFGYTDKKVDQPKIEAQRPIQVDFGVATGLYVDLVNRAIDRNVCANNRAIDQYVDSSQELIRRAL